jgi:hypothetical protein
MLFPNGFNNISLTGFITYSYISGEFMYTIHYMTKSGECASMGWDDKKDYILFKLLLIPPAYLGKDQCFVVQKYHLK